MGRPHSVPGVSGGGNTCMEEYNNPYQKDTEADEI